MTVPDVDKDIGYTYNGAHQYVAMEGDIVFQITAQYPQHKKPALAKRRFIYYWEKDFQGTKWVRHGLAMTDDDGFLFDLKAFFNDNIDNRNLPDNLHPVTGWKIKKFDHEKRVWADNKWNFFGGIEDTIAFQKWVSIPGLSQDTRENTEGKIYFSDTKWFISIDKENMPVFKYHFLVPEKYLLKFRPGRERFFMFCPPDIIDPTQYRQHKSEGSFFIAPEESNRNIDFRFMPEPFPAWQIHKYYVKKNEALLDILKKYNETQMRFFQCNKELIGNNPNLIKEGAALIVPGGTGSNPFGTYADERYIFENIDSEELLRMDRFPKIQENGNSLHCARILLATNLEEHLSNLAFHTCMLDMKYQQIVESSKAFIEASAKVRQMGDLLELMYSYPGYKKRVPCPGPGMGPADFRIKSDNLDKLQLLDEENRYNYVYYENSLEIDENKRGKVFEVSAQYHQYADELAEAPWNSNNPVFAVEKGAIYSEVDILEKIVTSPVLYRRLDEWTGYQLYGTSKNDYPYFLKISCNTSGLGSTLKKDYTSIIYRVIQDAFCLMLSMDLAQMPGKSEEKDTIAEAFYKRAVAPFEADLELKYLNFDAQHNIGMKILKLCKMPETCILKPGTDSSPVYNQYLLNIKYCKKEATLLQIVFKDVLLKHFSRQLSTYYQTIMMLSSRCRSAVILAETNTIRATQAAFSYLKVEIGKLVMAGADLKSITLELEQGAKEFASIKNANAKRVTALKIHKRGMNAPEVPKKLKALTSAFGFTYLLYETALFYAKCTDDQKNTPKDWYDFTKVLNSGFLWVAKFDPGWVKRLPVLTTIENRLSEGSKSFIGSKIKGLETCVFKPLQLYFVIIDAQIGLWAAFNYYEDGEELLCSLRAVQATVSVIAAFGTFFSFPIISSPISVVLLALVMVGIDAYRNIILMIRKGVENTIKDTRAQLNHMPLFKGKVTTFTDDCSYVLYYSHTIVSEQYTWNFLTPLLQQWQSISQLDEKIAWWNPDMIRAGSALKNMGYSFGQIAFICMEVQADYGLRQIEKDWIRFFADNETFCITQRKEPLRKTQTGEISFVPKGIEIYEKFFQIKEGYLELKTLPSHLSPAKELFQ